MSNAKRSCSWLPSSKMNAKTCDLSAEANDLAVEDPNQTCSPTMNNTWCGFELNKLNGKSWRKKHVDSALEKRKRFKKQSKKLHTHIVLTIALAIQSPWEDALGCHFLSTSTTTRKMQEKYLPALTRFPVFSQPDRWRVSHHLRMHWTKVWNSFWTNHAITK